MAYKFKSGEIIIVLLNKIIAIQIELTFINIEDLELKGSFFWFIKSYGMRAKSLNSKTIFKIYYKFCSEYLKPKPITGLGF